jgi:hypothetical protein
VFDEGSARKRISSLYEHDMRRELSKQGKLCSLPLQVDDFTNYDASQQAVRDKLTFSLLPVVNFEKY